MEITCIPRLTLMSRIPTGKGSGNIRALMMIFSVKKQIPTQETEVGSTLL